MVYQLMTHTSGMCDDEIRAFQEKEKDSIVISDCPPNQDPDINKRLHFIYSAPLGYPTGSKMSYCNNGYFLLGEIIRRASGKSLQDFAQERLFTPLGMKDTNYIVPESLWGRVVRRKPHNDSEEDWYTSPFSLKIPSPAGGIYSTVHDMAVFAQMYLNEGIYGDKRILSPVTVRQMTKDQIPGLSATYRDERFRDASWGYGWNVLGIKRDRGSLQSEKAYCHGGAGGTCIWIDPVYGIIGVWLSVEFTVQPSQFMNMVTSAITEL